jgi:hypothetical protein
LAGVLVSWCKIDVGVARDIHNIWQASSDWPLQYRPEQSIVLVIFTNASGMGYHLAIMIVQLM